MLVGIKARNVYRIPLYASLWEVNKSIKPALVWLRREDIHTGSQKQDKTGGTLQLSSVLPSLLVFVISLSLRSCLQVIELFHYVIIQSTSLLLIYSFLQQMFAILRIYIFYF